MDEMIKELNEKYSNLKFFGSRLSTSSGRIMFITSNWIRHLKDIKFKTLEKGRSGILCLNYKGQKLNIVNMYMPNQKPLQRETLRNLHRDLKNHQDLRDSELLCISRQLELHER